MRDPLVKLNYVPCPRCGNRTDFHSCPEQLAEGRDGIAALLAQAGELLPGDRVVKPKGYPFPGMVVATFKTRSGATRHVVESDTSPGLLHIFGPEQLERAER